MLPIVLFAGAASAAPALPPLSDHTDRGWSWYVSATEQRIARELSPQGRFLVQDFASTAESDRRTVMSGGIVVAPMETFSAQGRPIDVSNAMVHHWRGAVLLRNVTLDAVLKRLQSEAPPIRQEDVLQSAVLERGPDRIKVFLKLQRSKFVTVVYNTEHLVTFAHYGPSRASSKSVATKIAELENWNTPRERELPPGQDRGFLWRLNSYWRYQQVSGGVIAECESVTLSRGIPSLLAYLVRPLVESTARESMARTLDAFRSQLSRP